ncbi:MAG: multicopper oxidase domain-containing protein [Gammaproteobacteria bacterium]|nr:multicopper oxidase domain-containing protein [Gammaproteobacteria bacterium]
MKSRLFAGVAAVLMLGTAFATHAATVSYTLYITAGSLTVNGAGGATMNAWGYGTQAGAPVFPGPQITANEGDTVNVTVVNNHNINHNFVIQGATTDTTAIAPGGSRVYSFTASAAGTYLYSDTLNNNINREMGLYGSMVVKAAGGANTVWTGGPAYSFERTWVLGEMDKPRWNDVAGTGGTVSTATYKPNYFLINGQGGFDGMHNPATTIDGGVGQTALVRVVNGGQFSHSLHFHGNHIQVVTLNGVKQSSPYMQLDVINIPPNSTADVLYVLNQAGNYPMHIHTAQMEAANGVYLNGVATMITMR